MAKQTKALVEEAHSLGIDVDGRWSDETIQERIDVVVTQRTEEGQATHETADEGATEARSATAGNDGVAAGADVGSQVADDADPQPPEDGASDGVFVAPDGGHAGSNPSHQADDAGESPDPDGDPAAEGLAATDAGGADAGDVAGDEAAAKEADVVQQAMTKPILAAYQAACSVYGVLGGSSTDHFRINVDWMPGEEAEDKAINLVGHAAQFVRQWPEAPTEALYGHVASGGGVNLVLDVLWSELELPARLAWSTFRETLVSIDRAVAAERAAMRSEPRETRRVPIDETTLDEIEASFERTEVAGGPR